MSDEKPNNHLSHEAIFSGDSSFNFEAPAQPQQDLPHTSITLALTVWDSTSESVTTQDVTLHAPLTVLGVKLIDLHIIDPNLF